MNTGFSKSTSSTPEKHIPETDKKRNTAKLTGHRKNKPGLLMYTVKELQSLYEVQVNLPGLGREMFTIYGNDHSLSIDTVKGKKDHQDICMPENADAELTVAEYKNDILYLFIPKTTVSGYHTNTKIVVY